MPNVVKKPLLRRTASDLMSRDILVLAPDMPLRQAAHLLQQHGISGAPVVDTQGQCIGVLSLMDVLRWAARSPQPTQAPAAPLPLTCSFQTRLTGPDGREIHRCNLALGVCPLQALQVGPDGQSLVVCTQPHCVPTDWQVVMLDQVPQDEVRQVMTADPVTVSADTPIGDLARKMIDARIHRLIVVDDQHKPIGVVSSTDILAAVAYAAATVAD